MESISIGPLALPIAPLLLFGSVGLSAWLAQRWAGQPSAGDALWTACFMGLAAARLAHVLLFASAYSSHPWSVIDIRDGGWFAPAGVFVAAAWVAWRVWQRPALRQPVAGAAGLALVLWLGASWALNRHAADSLPNIAVTSLASERQENLATLAKGQPSVVNLWATWCGPCRVEMPLLAAAAQAHGGSVRFVLVNQGEAASTIQTYLQRERLPFSPDQVWLDHQSRLGPALGSTGLPTTVFIGRDGQIADIHMGVLSAAALQVQIERLLR